MAVAKPASSVPMFSGSNSAAALINPFWGFPAAAIFLKFNLNLPLWSQLHTLPEEDQANQALLSPFCQSFAYLKLLITLHLKLSAGCTNPPCSLPSRSSLLRARRLVRRSAGGSLSQEGAQIWPQCSSDAPRVAPHYFIPCICNTPIYTFNGMFAFLTSPWYYSSCGV